MQTLQALGALVIVALLGLSIQRSLVSGDGRMMRNETEASALAAATDLLDRAGTLRFDARPNTIQTAMLTPAANFGMVSDSPLDATDVDDLHGLRDTVRIAAPGGTLTLERTVTVRYVDRVPGGYAPSATPTFVKEVSVVVQGPVRGRATLTRLFGHRPGIQS
jgi:Flp pilus assembly protein TadG